MQVVERFLASSSSFDLESAVPHLPEQAKVMAQSNGTLTTLPTDGCDGFFAACLRRAL